MVSVIFKVISEIIIVIIPIFLSLPKKWINFDFLLKLRNNYSLILLIILFFAIILRYFFETRIKNYHKQIEKLNHIVMAYQQFIIVSIEELLKDIFNTLQLTEKDRITLYLYSSSTNKFYFAGRYSSAPKYKKQGRTIIDNEEEYVYKVLNEEAKDHYKNAPSIKNGIKEKRTMESKSMYGVPIWDTNHTVKIGVVIFQSMKENAYRNKEVRKKVQEQVKRVEKLVNDMKINPSILPTDTKPIKGL